MSDITLKDLTPTTMTWFFKILDERIRIVGKHFKKGIKKSTVATYWSKLNSFFSWLKEKKLIPESPFAGMQYPSPVYEDRKYLKREAVEKILTAIWNHSTKALLLKRNLVIFHILLFCGLRREELVLLQVRDINIERRMLTVRAETSKTPRTRYIPLNSKVILHLKDYLNERKRFTTQYLFVSNTRDDKLSYDGLHQLVARIKCISNVKFHLHQLRHTFAVNFLNAGGDVAKLKQLLGHKDISMTMIYLRCIPTYTMQRDVENMNLDNFI